MGSSAKMNQAHAMQNHILWEKMQVRVKQDNEGKRGGWGGTGRGGGQK